MSTAAHPKPIRLAHGAHRDPKLGLCYNEAVAYAAGEPHSDMPACVSPVIRRFGMTLNDRLDDERRQLLRPFVLRAIGTAGDGRDEERQRMCVEWLVEHLPVLLEKAGLPDAAAAVRGLDGSLAEENVLRVLRDAREQAWAVRSKRYAELRTRVREAVREEFAKRNLTISNEDDAAVAAAAAVAEAAVAEAAAEVAVPYSSRWWKIRDAVYAKVRPAVEAKVRELLGPTVDELLPSALDLFDRMLPPTPLQQPAIPNAEQLFADPVGEGS